MLTRMPQGSLRLLILAAQYFPAVGGSEAQARLLAREFKRRGVQVEVWTRRLQATQGLTETVDDVPVRRLGPALPFRASWARKIERFGFMIRLYRELRSAGRRFDVTFSNQLQYPATVAVLAGRVTGIATVARVAASGPESEMRHRGFAFRRQRLILTRGLSRVVALGPLTRLECERGGFLSSRVVVIPNAVSIPPHPRASALAAAPVRAIWLGKFRPEKRADLAVMAWTDASLPGTLSMVGDGDQRERVASLVARCQTQKGADSVDMTGAVDDPRGELSRAQVFIQSSDTEGMSNALLEAMASGCACVATDVGETRFVLGGEGAPAVGAGDFVEAEAGLLVRPSDVGGMARALTALADGPTRERLGSAAYRQCVLNHGIDRIVDRYLELFRKVGPPKVV